LFGRAREFTHDWTHRRADGTGVYSKPPGEGYPAGIYQSESAALPIIWISLQTNPKAVHLNIWGEVGRPYRLQISPDLQSWSDYLIYTKTAPTFQFLDPVATGPTQRFYRVVSP
jgi:hypothetical protein